MGNYPAEIVPYDLSSETTVSQIHSSQIHCCENPIDNSSVSTWVLNHEDEYEMILNECIKEANNTSSLISLRGIIMQLNGEKKINIDYMCEEYLAYFICQEYPELQGRFKKYKQREKRISGTQLLRLLSQYLPV